jgi:hypothetical protein
MFPAVVIDLGTRVPAAEAAWVLESCNAAIVNGSCELDTTASEPPRALAIVRWLGSQRLAVRIEVGLREAERAAWSVRELDFLARDPVRERWRSVGLVVATLVGEVEAGREPGPDAAPPLEDTAPTPPISGQPASEQQPAEPATAAASEVPVRGTPAPPAAPEAAAPPPSRRAPAPVAKSPTSVEVPLPHVPLARRPLFIGAGVLAGQGATFDPLRWGAGLRAGWISPAGWVLSGSADYSRFELDVNALEAGWFRLAFAPGYRFWLSERWSIDLGLELGARVLRAVPNAAGSQRRTAWSAQGAGHLEGWWQAFASGGAWAGLTLASIGRETRLLGRDRTPDVVVPLAELHGMLGVWWSP